MIELPENAPISEEQRAALNEALGSLSVEQQHWISGFLAGASAPAENLSPATGSNAPELTILFGSESGNSEELADRTKELAGQAGFRAKVVDMAEVNTNQLSDAKNLLVIVSTWGEGDPPDTAADFHTEIMSDKAACFEGIRYSVCALGDTSYEQFCETGKQIDRRLAELGGNRIFDRQDCDVDFEDDWSKWAEGALRSFPAPKPASLPTPNGSKPVAKGGKTYSKKNPFPAALRDKILLNGTGSAKETIHLELDLGGSGLLYIPGDSLAVVAQNRDEDVARVLDAAGLDGNESFNEGQTLAAALKTGFDITSLTSRIAGKYNQIAKSKKLAAALDPEKRKKFAEWTHGRQLVDLLETYPCDELTAGSLTGIMRKMAPRLYSIASSLKAHPEEVHLTVAAVRYHTHGKDRAGVASTYLADRLDLGKEIPVYVHSNKNFRLPEDPVTPVIMIGPGTGIAPFRAFVEERKAMGATGKNWLIFGDQHYSYDFLYQIEWQKHLKEGSLHRLDVAFSRDQPHKIYVQDRLKESAADIYRWIEEGAHIYVCGDASRMAPDVHNALIEILAGQSGASSEEAEARLGEMKKQRRYQRDVY